MSSSISSSDSAILAVSPPPPAPPAPPRALRRVLASGQFKSLLVVAVIQLIVEVCLRTFGMSFHAERATLKTFDGRAQQLSQRQGTRVLLVGNSLTVCGYDLDLFNRQTAAKPAGPPFYVDSMALHASGFTEWYFIFKRNFVDAGRPLDILVVNLSPSAGADYVGDPQRVSWIPQEAGWRNVPEAMEYHLTTFDQRGELLTASVFTPFAGRNELRFLIHNPTIAYYWESLLRINDTMKAAAAKAAQDAPSKPRPAATYGRLQRLMSLAAAHHIRIIFVAMPTREFYELDPELGRTIRAGGMELMDCRTIDGLTADGFADVWHLNKQGEDIFTRYMADHLPQEAAQVLAGH